MGWANCGADSRGRLIGYAHFGVCDHPGCDKEIDRGLGYKCGPMHGDNSGLTCEGYFCEAHRVCVEFKPGTFACEEIGPHAAVCKACYNRFEADGVLSDD